MLKCPELDTLVARQVLETGDEIKVDLRSGECVNTIKKTPFSVEPMSAVQYDIHKAGSLFSYGKKSAG